MKANKKSSVSVRIAAACQWSAAMFVVTINAAAQMPDNLADPQEVEGVVVTATRQNIAVSEAPASVTIITSQQIEQRRSARIGDVLGEELPLLIIMIGISF